MILEGRDAALPMAGGEMGEFTLVLPHLDGTARYAVAMGGSRWPDVRPFYTLTVLARATVEDLRIGYDYPAYTHLAGKTVEHADGPIEAPAGSRATIAVTFSQAPGQAAIELRDGPVMPMSPSPDGRTFTVGLTVEKDSAYRIVVRDARSGASDPARRCSRPARGARRPSGAGAAGRLLPHPGRGGSPPRRSSFLAPNRDVTLPPGGHACGQDQGG